MMLLNNNSLFMIELVKQYFKSSGKDCSVPDFAFKADFNEILTIAAYNYCDPFVYEIIQKWSVNYGMDANVLMQYKKRMLFSSVCQLRADEELKEVIKSLDSANIKFMLLKGALLSCLYPNPAYRRSYDADIHISEEYFEHAEKIFIDRGYKYIQKDSIKSERTYILEETLSIELHTQLFENFYEKNRSAIVASGFESPSNRIKTNVFGLQIETFNPDHFLIYVICHHTKHFITSGINMRHIIDICVYVNMYNDQLNWKFIFSSLERFGIEHFTMYLLYISHKYLGMVDLSDLYQGINEDIAIMLLHDIVEKNTEQYNILERESAQGIIKNIYYFNDGENNRFSMIKNSLFPNTKLLANKYLYAKKHSALLPIAWIHRAFSFAYRKAKGRKLISPYERAQLAEERIELLKRVQIL